MARIAVNGLGRIGRAFVKLVLARPELEVVAVNDLVDPEDLVSLSCALIPVRAISGTGRD